MNMLFEGFEAAVCVRVCVCVLASKRLCRCRSSMSEHTPDGCKFVTQMSRIVEKAAFVGE